MNGRRVAMEINITHIWLKIKGIEKMVTSENKAKQNKWQKGRKTRKKVGGQER